MGARIKTLWDHAKEEVMAGLSKKLDRGCSSTVSEEDVIKKVVELSKRTPYVKAIRKRKSRKAEINHDA